MKSIYLFLILTVSFVANSQEMENITLKWMDDTSSFLLNDTLVSLRTEGAGSSKIKAPFKNFYGFEYSFKLSLDFAPSSSNKVRLYLAGNEHPDDVVVLDLGESGSNDQWVLRQLSNGEEVQSQRGSQMFGQPFTDLEIKLQKEINNWIVFIGEDSLDINASLEQDSLFFGLSCFYTSSNANGFHLSRFKGKETLKDNDPPQLDTLYWLNKDSIHLVFNEEVKINQDPFSSVKRMQKASLNIDNHLFTLNIEITDRNENKSIVDTSFYSKQMEFQSFAFNELMIDPSPSLGVYEEEYIELINLSGRDLSKTELYMVYNQDTSLISIDEWLRDSLLVLYDQKLSNTSFNLELLDPYGGLIDHFEYNHLLFSKKKHSDGGWSLEKMDPDYFGDYVESWAFHESFQGGSPGILNETEELTDEEAPYIEWVEINEVDTLFHFNEPVYSDNAVLNIVKGLEDIKDLSGNSMKDTTLVMDCDKEIVSGDLVISEILFRPSDDIPEFIELLNQSGKTILLDGLWLAKEINDEVIPIYRFPPKLVQSNERFTICSDKYLLRIHDYLDKSTVLHDAGFPDLLSSEMHLLLINQNEELIDEILYNMDWTPDNLNLSEGYSFERVGENGVVERSWRVSSYSSNYASPGLLNTQSHPKAEMLFHLQTKSVNDVIVVDYSGVESCFAELKLYNMNGSLIESLSDPIWLGSDGQIKVYRTKTSYSGQAILNLILITESGQRTIENLACYLN